MNNGTTYYNTSIRITVVTKKEYDFLNLLGSSPITMGAVAGRIYFFWIPPVVGLRQKTNKKSDSGAKSNGKPYKQYIKGIQCIKQLNTFQE